jgi:drug/metabolite transporter (DMT)-like permease
MSRYTRFAVPAAFIGLGLIWGSSFLWIKIAVEELPAATLAAERITVGALVMLVYLRAVGMRLPTTARELLPLAVLYFFLIAELGATLASMVTYVFPVVGVALGVVFLEEVLDLRLVAGTALVMAGIVVVTLRYDSAVSRAVRGNRP